jgi:hypothetical protein
MAQGAFEVETGTMQRFLDLLRAREEQLAPAKDEPLPRRAVFVAPLTRTSTEGAGILVVTRRVRAGFAYGADLVSLTRLTSDGYEFPEPSDDHRKRAALQDEVLSKTREELEEGLRRFGLSVPVAVGWLRLPGDAAVASGPGDPA